MAEGRGCLIVGPAWVGDMVMAQCLFQALKDVEPDMAIDVLAPAWTVPIVRRMPEVREAIEGPFRHGALQLGDRWRIARRLRGRYDRAYVLPNSLKSALIPVIARIRRRIGYVGEHRFGLINDIRTLPEKLKRRTARGFQSLVDIGPTRRPHLEVDADNQRRICERWSLGPGGYVALAPGAEFGPSKRWPADRYAAVARHFVEQGTPVVIAGSSRDGEIGQAIVEAAPDALDLCGETTLDDAVDLLAAASLVVTNDSGLMHIAAAVDVATVAIFGSSSAAHTPPLSPRAVVVSDGIECSPCFQRTCPLGHTDCLNNITVDTVLEAAGQAVRRLESVAPAL